jgi:hypothetical protein
MRTLLLGVLAVGGALATASNPAAAAPGYPYCMQSQAFGTDCTYPTYAACQMTASGLGYDCIANPRLGYDPRPSNEPRRSRRSYSY